MGLLEKLSLSRLGLKGIRPNLTKGAVSTSNTHAQGPAPFKIEEKKSTLDLDGKTPKKYMDNPPT